MQDQTTPLTKTYAIGLDLGGTFVKYALVDSSGHCLTHGKFPSLAHVSAAAVTGQVVKAAFRVLEFARENGIPVQGIGIGTPGIVDETQRIVVGAAENIREWENIPLADRMEEEVSLPTRIGNDANLMGWGETLFGAARGCSHVVFLTIGTGIGGAVVIGHRLFNGFANRGTELGHIPLIADGEPCACGSVGCLETYASATALVRHYRTALEQATGKKASETGAIDGEEVVRRYLQGEPLAVQCMERHFSLLGRGIAGLIHIFSPQRIVIGGGLAEAGPFYIRQVAQVARQHAMPACLLNTSFAAATLGNRAGCIGAASLLLRPCLPQTDVYKPETHRNPVEP
ncbi:MAG: ROK family protein [Bacteroides sp.]|nr:ROK family protein [Bacteroides sp.]